MCPWCGSRERHRFVWLYLQRTTALFADSDRLLHFAPESGIVEALERAGPPPTITTDLKPAGVDVAADITALPLCDGAVRWVYCSHVLEHITDDMAALAEIRRVMQPDGTAIIQVPVRAGPTLEDSSITNPRDRLEAFGQEDHVRHYGHDITTRLEAAGFDVEIFTPDSLCSPHEIRRFGLLPTEVLFDCTPASEGPERRKCG